MWGTHATAGELSSSLVRARTETIKAKADNDSKVKPGLGDSECKALGKAWPSEKLVGSFRCDQNRVRTAHTGKSSGLCVFEGMCVGSCVLDTK